MIQTIVENITPERAAHYLKRNVDNYRNMSKSKITMYAEEMKAGKWQLNGEGIVFDESGKLKNGQHRLAAIIQAGVPIQMTVTTGVSENVTIYDNGMSRTTKQMAQAGGATDISNTETAVATALVGRFNPISKGQVLDWIGKHASDLKRAYRISGANNRKSMSSRMSCVLGAYLMSEVRNMKSFEIETFFKVFNSGNIIGTDGYEPSSALVCRRMFEERYRGMPTNQRVMKEQTEIMVLALDDFRKGKKRQLNYQVKEPLQCMDLIDAIRKADGLTDASKGA